MKFLRTIVNIACSLIAYSCIVIGKLKFSNHKRILIVRLDAIGDYILFRNFIDHISSTYKDYSITILGNSAWRDLAEELDKKQNVNFIWVKSPLSITSRPYRLLTFIGKVTFGGYSIAICPVYSRTYIADIFVFLSGAKKRIGVNYDTDTPLRSRLMIINNKLYTQLINVPNDIIFEFKKNKYIAEHITQQAIDCHYPQISYTFARDIEQDYMLIFPGASDIKRRWSADNMVKIARRIIQTTNIQIVLAGGKSEMTDAAYLEQHLESSRERIINKVSQTTLLQLAGLIKHAQFILTNETSAVHFAAAVRTPAICILGGGHFGRFMPYPNALDKPDLPRAMYCEMKCFNCDWNCIYSVESEQPYPCIAKVGLEEVWKQVSKQIDCLQNKAMTKNNCYE